MKKVILIFGGALLSMIILPRLAYPGFEVGNGRRVVRNAAGNYQIIVSDKLEVGFASKLTELMSPFAEGTPRARLQINIVRDSPFDTFQELLSRRPDSSWQPVRINGMDGIRQDETLPTRLHQVEIRLFSKPNEMIVITVEGTPRGTGSANLFEGMENSLGSFEMLR